MGWAGGMANDRTGKVQEQGKEMMDGPMGRGLLGPGYKGPLLLIMTEDPYRPTPMAVPLAPPVTVPALSSMLATAVVVLHPPPWHA